MSRRLLIAFAGLVVAASCGIPRDDAPQPINQALPAPVVDPASTTSSRPAAATRPATLYFVRERADSSDPDVLEALTVAVPFPSDPSAFPRAVLDQLVKGVPADIAERGLRSDIPPTVRVLDVRRPDQGKVLEVNLTDLGKVEGPKQRIAVAQIVFTATALDGITAVRFLVDGQATAIPIDQGSADAGDAISRDDFPRLKRALEGHSDTSTSRSSSTTSSSTSTSTSSTLPRTTTTSRPVGSTSSTATSSTTSTTAPGSTVSTGGPAASTP